MKTLLVIALPIVLVAAVAFGFLTFSKSEVKEEKKDKKEHSCCSEIAGSKEISENSIYQLDSKWINQDNKEVELKEFKGKPVVLTMFYSSCTYACPILVNDMKRIEAQVPENKRSDYRFVLVTFDPERDTPAKLKELAISRGLDTNRWTLLTGSKDNVMELAAILGFKFKKEADGTFSHSNIINLLNEKGEVEHQQTGLNQDVSQTVTELSNL